MTLSEADINAIIKGAADRDDSSLRPRWSLEMRQMLNALAKLEFRPARVSPLVRLCETGARYGWQSVESAGNPSFLAAISRKAKASLTRDLRRNLERLTRPCFELQRTSFGLALNSIELAGSADSRLIDRRFLGDTPSHRLFALFKDFPVLARLWSQLISQWHEHVTEVVSRFVADRRALAHSFFRGQPLRTIANTRCSLSDSHRHGRTVMELQFESGAVIYKPRSGDGEWEWNSLLEWMNLRSFRPKLRAARVLTRQRYCWMEYAEAAPCQSEAAARRFYQRMGGIIAAAYLLKAVDCHRNNLIASGEYPVLVDVDALWHVSRLSKTQSFSDVLYRTGFFPTTNPRSLQSRSSTLGPWGAGNHVPRLARESLFAADYQREIVHGFATAWRCLLGTANRRAAFARRIRRIRSRKRRWIYWATEKYAAIRKASIQPPVLRSGAERNLLIRRLCSREIVPSTVVDAEILALKRLDIPYFERKTTEMPPADRLPIPEELIGALRSALPACAAR